MDIYTCQLQYKHEKSIVFNNAFFMFSNDCHDKSDKLNEWMDSI
jgi:hypothetical protein